MVKLALLLIFASTGVWANQDCGDLLIAKPLPNYGRLVRLERKARALRADGSDLEIEISQSRLTIKRIGETPNPVLQKMRRRMQRHGIEFHFDYDFYYGAITRGKSIFIHPHFLANPAKAYEFESFVYHEIVHATAFRKCLDFGTDCGKLIMFKARPGESLPGLPEGYEAEHSSDEIEAHFIDAGRPRDFTDKIRRLGQLSAFFQQLKWLKILRKQLDGQDIRGRFEFEIPFDGQVIEIYFTELQDVRSQLTERIRQLENIRPSTSARVLKTFTR